MSSRERTESNIKYEPASKFRVFRYCGVIKGQRINEASVFFIFLCSILFASSNLLVAGRISNVRGLGGSDLVFATAEVRRSTSN